MKRLVPTIIFLLGISFVYAAKVDTVEVYSASMKKKIKTVVVSPERGTPKATLYLLHGYSGNYGNWVNKTPQIKNWVDQNEYLIVCPDGGYDSWYWDIEGTGDRYETFVSKELVAYIEQQYGAPSDRAKRGITGLSMGGHGALYLAIRHQDVFANAGSTSGGVDIRPFPNNWSIKKRIGDYHDNQQAWNNHTVIELIHQIRPGNLKLFIDCGTEDFFFGVNNALHEKLTYMNVPHDYLTMPGKHDWNYWSKSIDFQMTFFNQCFQDKPVAK